MPLLSNREACDVTDAFLLTLYGSNTFNRWKKLKCRMQFDTESDYVNWVLDVVEHYESDGNSQLVGTAVEDQPNKGIKSEYVEGEGCYERSGKRVKYEEQSEISVQIDSGATWTGGDDYIGSAELSHGARSKLFNAQQTGTSRQHVKLHSRGHRQQLLVAGNTEDSRPRSFPHEDITPVLQDTTTDRNEVTVSSDYSDIDQDAMAIDDPSKACGAVEDPYFPSAGSSSTGQETSQLHSSLSTITPPCIEYDDIAMQMQPGVFSCTYCKYTARYRGSVKRHHISVHQRLKPYECTLCEYSSSRKDKLREHVQKKHGVNQRSRTATQLAGGSTLELG